MSVDCTGEPGGGAIRRSAAGAADWLYLAAAPTFAIMALLTGALGGALPDGLCSTAVASPLGGMVPMYLLMSAFHLPPWLRLLGRRNTSAGSEGMSAKGQKEEITNCRELTGTR